MVELVVLVVVPGGTGTGTIAQNAAKARTLSFTFDFFYAEQILEMLCKLVNQMLPFGTGFRLHG